MRSKANQSPSPTSVPTLVLEQWSASSIKSWQALIGDPNRPDEICICACHVIPGMVHCKPCCRLCPDCHLPIQELFWADHPLHCGQYLGPQDKNHHIVEPNDYQQ